MVEGGAFKAVMTEVVDLRREVAALGAGMGHVLTGQQAQTALLEALLAAVADMGGEGAEDGLTEALGRIADSLDAQAETLDGMRAGLDAIPGAVAAAVGAAA